LIQGQPKRNTAIGRAESAIGYCLSDTLLAWECDLFDRDREPSDQPCNLVQTFGIVILDSLCEPNEAFLIAHRGDVVWDDGRHRSHQIGLDVWHRITSMARIRHWRASWVNASFSGSVRGAQMQQDRPVRRPIAILQRCERDDKSLRRRQFTSLPDVAPERPIWSFARLGGFVIRSPLRTGFAYSSVAQR
jgi:hypothetical protein